MNCHLISCLFFFVTSSLYPMGLVKKTFGGFKHITQEYVPEFYINWWSMGQANEHDIYHAAKKGRINFLETAYEFNQKKQNLDFFNFHNERTGKTPLSVAVESDQIAAVKFLLATDTNVNLFNGRYGLPTPLHVALRNKNMFMVGLLSAHNPNLAAHPYNKELSALSLLIKSYTDKERTFILDYLTKHQNMDSTINTLFDQNNCDALNILAKTNIQTGKKIITQAINRNNNVVIKEISSGDSSHLNTIAKNLDQE